MDTTRPVGVFDSGLGGFTVLSAIAGMLPNENLIYFGDTARVPYGSKSPSTIISYAQEITEFLLEQNVKAIMVACNSVSSHALPEIRSMTDIPVVGVVEPGALALLNHFAGVRRAGVIATRSTVNSRRYSHLLNELDPGLHVEEKACPLFVPLIEEGLTEHPATDAIIREYLDDFARTDIRHIILGCTHYPLLKAAILRHYPQFSLVDSSVEAANFLKEVLYSHKLQNPGNEPGDTTVYFSDITDQVTEMTRVLFPRVVSDIRVHRAGW